MKDGAIKRGCREGDAVKGGCPEGPPPLLVWNAFLLRLILHSCANVEKYFGINGYMSISQMILRQDYSYLEAWGQLHINI